MSWRIFSNCSIRILYVSIHEMNWTIDVADCSSVNWQQFNAQDFIACKFTAVCQSTYPVHGSLCVLTIETKCRPIAGGGCWKMFCLMINRVKHMNQLWIQFIILENFFRCCQIASSHHAIDIYLVEISVYVLHVKTRRSIQTAQAKVKEEKQKKKTKENTQQNMAAGNVRERKAMRMSENKVQSLFCLCFFLLLSNIMVFAVRELHYAFLGKAFCWINNSTRFREIRIQTLSLSTMCEAGWSWFIASGWMNNIIPKRKREDKFDRILISVLCGTAGQRST